MQCLAWLKAQFSHSDNFDNWKQNSGLAPQTEAPDGVDDLVEWEGKCVDLWLIEISSNMFDFYSYKHLQTIYGIVSDVTERAIQATANEKT